MVPLVPAAGEEVLLSPEVLDTATQAIAQLVEGDTVQERRAAAADVAKQVKASGLAFLRATSLVQELMAHLEAPTTGSSRDLTSLNVNSKQGALLGIWAMCELAPHASEPFLVPELGRLLSFCSDRSVDVSDAAAQAARALVNNMSPYATSRVVPVILEQMFSSKSKWLVKRTCAVLLADLTAKAPKEISLHFPVIVPHLSDLMVDSKPEVAESAWSAMQEVCTLVDNSDIEPFALQLLNCIVDPTRVPDLVHQLGAITFAQIVTRGTLALMVPLLIRGLRERNTPVKRKCAAIIDNMCRLVESPAEVAPFVGMLLPSLDNVRKEVADPECREVVDAAYRTLQRVSGQAEGFDADAEAAKDAELPQAALGLLKEALEEHVPDADLDEMDETLMQHVAHLSCSLVHQQRFTMDVWSTVCTRYLAAAHFSKPEEDVHICQGFLDRCRHAFAHRGQAGNDGDDEEGVDLCDAEFSLAYGGRILLNNAHLRLKVGRRYGLCGANGVGKSTLMRAISRGQVDGFPPADQLRTVYVEHDIQGATEDMSVVDFVLSDPDLASSGREKVEEALRNVGFLPSMMALSIVSLSGGWKMKLALARAMLLNAGLLLLDEPTNHLDVNNVKWLQDYLTSGLQDVTCLIVSHDTSFLDTVCTDIIDYANRKLTRYKGNLSEFVKVKPEARAYYSLQSNNLEFSFPKPGFLDGVKSREKPVLKAKKVSFTYEGASKPQLTGVSLKCSLGSRIAVLGANGAGKSTLIKLLTGELKPESGEVDKHPNLRLAYVAQHAFHHIEEFLELTPNLYISKRFARGEDIEEKEKVFRKMSEEERSRLQTFYVKGKNVVVKEAGPGVMERKIDCLLSRRKKKRNFEYEVRWKGLMSLEYNSWLARDLLIETGHGKMVNELDGKKAAAAGDTRQLTKANIEAFLSDFGLDAEIATHSHIRGLSGGQKVKLVLAAAMWHNPHLLIMDEPTNYLDRDSLGALATAIQRFEGGVILISHNSEFVSALCNEEWRVADGKVAVVKKAGPAEAEAMEGSASGTNKAA